jgi:hypothetical protein
VYAPVLHGLFESLGRGSNDGTIVVVNRRVPKPAEVLPVETVDAVLDQIRDWLTGPQIDDGILSRYKICDRCSARVVEISIGILSCLGGE